ncbi:hypothetical protein NE454_26575 [Blautia producta]|uniref:hypothetical protein n=1 Tax=Blautia producta TaxID=33035 RepID=UPI002109BCEC|nr:hypothetical protein [Blautia producta]MCQ5127958.1 hypothetical protein [Blautia producta]
MTPGIEFLELLTSTAEENCNLDSQISLDELSAGNSLYAELGEGFTEARYYNKSTVKTIPVLFLCRNVSQTRCIEQLSDICNYFQRLRDYPRARTFSWLDTEIVKEPSKIGRDEDGTWHYSCILNNKIYY